MIFFKRHKRKSHSAVTKRAKKINQMKMGRFLSAVLWRVNGMSSLMLKDRWKKRPFFSTQEFRISPVDLREVSSF